MANLSLPSAGSLRETITFQQSSMNTTAPDGAGGWSVANGSAWADKIANVRARVTPTMKGTEAVIDQGLQGIAFYDVWVRCNSDTDTLTDADRIVWTRFGVTTELNIRLIQNADEKHKWYYILAQSGVAQ